MTFKNIKKIDDTDGYDARNNRGDERKSSDGIMVYILQIIFEN